MAFEFYDLESGPSRLVGAGRGPAGGCGRYRSRRASAGAHRPASAPSLRQGKTRVNWACVPIAFSPSAAVRLRSGLDNIRSMRPVTARDDTHEDHHIRSRLCARLRAALSRLTCKEDTAAKKLAGAAATSHMKKCETDAKAKCEADSSRQEARRRGQDQPHEEVRGRRGRQLEPHPQPAFAARRAPRSRARRAGVCVLDFPAVVGPVQQRLALAAAAEQVARLAVLLHLADVAADRLPALDLAAVLRRHAAAHVIAAVPLEPAARVVLVDPALLAARPTAAGWRRRRRS